MSVNDCLECAELTEDIFKLRSALQPFLQPGVGLVFDTRRDGAVVIRCRHCSAWTGGHVETFKHDSNCIYAKAKRALDETQHA